MWSLGVPNSVSDIVESVSETLLIKANAVLKIKTTLPFLKRLKLWAKLGLIVFGGPLLSSADAVADPLTPALLSKVEGIGASEWQIGYDLTLTTTQTSQSVSSVYHATVVETKTSTEDFKYWKFSNDQILFNYYNSSGLQRFWLGQLDNLPEVPLTKIDHSILDTSIKYAVFNLSPLWLSLPVEQTTKEGFQVIHSFTTPKASVYKRVDVFLNSESVAIRCLFYTGISHFPSYEIIVKHYTKLKGGGLFYDSVKYIDRVEHTATTLQCTNLRYNPELPPGFERVVAAIQANNNHYQEGFRNALRTLAEAKAQYAKEQTSSALSEAKEVGSAAHKAGASQLSDHSASSVTKGGSSNSNEVLMRLKNKQAASDHKDEATTPKLNLKEKGQNQHSILGQKGQAAAGVPHNHNGSPPIMKFQSLRGEPSVGSGNSNSFLMQELSNNDHAKTTFSLKELEDRRKSEGAPSSHHKPVVKPHLGKTLKASSHLAHHAHQSAHHKDLKPKSLRPKKIKAAHPLYMKSLAVSKAEGKHLDRAKFCQKRYVAGAHSQGSLQVAGSSARKTSRGTSVGSRFPAVGGGMSLSNRLKNSTFAPRGGVQPLGSFPNAQELSRSSRISKGVGALCKDCPLVPPSTNTPNSGAGPAAPLAPYQKRVTGQLPELQKDGTKSPLKQDLKKDSGPNAQPPQEKDKTLKLPKSAKGTTEEQKSPDHESKTEEDSTDALDNLF